jgi:hypothetical protein
MEFKSSHRNIFDSDDACYVHRRLREKGLDMLDHLCTKTKSWARDRGLEDTWQLNWRMNLPTLAYNNTEMQELMSAELLAEVPDLESAATLVYMLYARHTYGKAVNGDINMLEFQCPPFSEFYHAFLTRLSADRAVVRLEDLQADGHLNVPESTTKNAVLDALRDVLRRRVVIKERLTREEFRARKAAEAAAAASARVPSSAPAAPALRIDDACSIVKPAKPRSDTASAVSTVSAVSRVITDWIGNLDKKAGQNSVVSAHHDAYSRGGVRPSDSASQVVPSQPRSRSPVAAAAAAAVPKQRTISLALPTSSTKKDSSKKESISSSRHRSPSTTSSSSSSSSDTDRKKRRGSSLSPS